MKGLLLWTERPVLLPRERETHEWMMDNRPWERFGLELIHDAEPGGWPRYAASFREAWMRGRREKLPLLNVESDVVPTLRAFEEVLDCPEEVCTAPYENVMLGDTPRFGAVVERRVRGGWESTFATPGERVAVDADLGFVRFSARALRRPYPDDETSDVGLMGDFLLNTAIFRVFRRPGPEPGIIHLHWLDGKGLRTNHLTWDRGDDAHHPPERVPEMHRVHARWLDPTLSGA